MNTKNPVQTAVDTARLVWERAQDEARKARAQYDNHLAEARRAAQSEADTLYRPAILAANDVAARAKAVYEEKLVELAESGTTLADGLTIGMRVCKWKYVGTFRGGFVQTDTYGAIEVWTHERDRAHASNPRPHVGDLCIRILRKNGEPSLRVDRMNRTFRSDLWSLPMDWRKA